MQNDAAEGPHTSLHLKASTNNTTLTNTTATNNNNNNIDNNSQPGINRLTVAVRIRPLNSKELGRENVSIIARCIDDQTVIVNDPSEDYLDILRKDRNRDRIYSFDVAFSEKATQVDVFEKTTKTLVDSVIKGFNATVFAYGATGAGKTHTMLGTDTQPGIMSLTMISLFEKLRAEDEQSKGNYDITLTYLEIYNENIRDLLSGKPEFLELRDDGHKGVVVSGITSVRVTSTEQVLSFLKKGNRNRTIEATGANEVSSRSHAVLQICVGYRAVSPNGHSTERFGKLSMIDLAGSERAAETKNRGMRMLEGANINRSLLALGNCINALGGDGKKAKYVNYRDSKLTRLLKDSLGGNCRTVMIANVSPASLHFEESHNTLKYAGRARMIKTKLSQQVYYKYDPYSAAVNSLQSEIGDLKTKLKRRALSGSALALDTIKDSRDLMSSAPRSRERLSRSRSQSRNRLVAGLDGTVGGGGGGGGVRGDDAGSIMSLNYSGGGSSSKLLSNNINNNSTQQQPYNNFVELEEYEMTLERLFQQHAEAQSKLLQIDDELADNSIRLRRKRNYVIKLERIIRRESLEGYNVQPSALKREAEVRVVKSKTDIENFKNERMRLKTSRTAAAKNLLDIEEKIRMLQQNLPKSIDKKGKKLITLLFKSHNMEMEASALKTTNVQISNLLREQDDINTKISKQLDIVDQIQSLQTRLLEKNHVTIPSNLADLMSEYKRITDTTKDESPSSSSLQDVSETGDDEIMTSDYNNEPVPPQRQAIPKAAAIGSSYSSSRTEHPLIQQQYSGNDIISPPRSDFSFIAKEDQNVLSPNDSTENMMYLIKRPEFHHQINGPFLPTIEGNSTSNNTSAKKLARLSNINNQQRRSRIGDKGSMLPAPVRTSGDKLPSI